MPRKFFLIFLFVLSFLSLSFAQKRYETVEGKIMGIWPHNNRFTSLEKLEELKARWGFNNLLIAAIYGRKEFDLANKAGYDNSNIMYQFYLPDIKVDRQKVVNTINQIGKIGSYYFDEPISRKQSLTDFVWLLKYLSEEGFYPHARFVMSEINETRAVKVDFLVDEIMYSGYGDRNKLGEDQRKTWSEWQQIFKDKFSVVWISSLDDEDHYRTLFKAAKEFGMNGVWFYQLEPLDKSKECTDDNFEKFCQTAVEFGFMRVVN